MSDNEFDKKFQNGFENFEVAPSQPFWSSIAARLEDKKSRKRIPLFWMAAASVAVIFVSGLYLLRPKARIWLHNEEVAQAEVKPKQKEPQPESLQLPFQKKEAGFEVAVKIKESALYQPVRKAETSEKDEIPEVVYVEKTAAYVNKATAKIETHESPVNIEVASIPAQNTAVSSLSQADSMPQDRGITAIKPRIKSVGDLVNFVVAKVDQREDKIIEMSDNDEGSSISAINLGVLKIKAGKNKAPGEFKVNFK